MADFIPTKEDELLAWSSNMAQHLSATPERFNLSDEQVRDFKALHDAFADLYRKTHNPCTKTPVVVAQKKVAKTMLVNEARRLSRWIQAQLSTTDAVRMTLGLTIAKPRPQRIGPPTQQPTVHVESVSSRGVTIRLLRDDGKCAKPEGAASASVFAYVGEQPPRDVDEWRYMGSTSKAVTEVAVSDSWAGATVWLCACWRNARFECGPVSEPVSLMSSFQMLRLAA